MLKKKDVKKKKAKPEDKYQPPKLTKFDTLENLIVCGE